MRHVAYSNQTRDASKFIFTELRVRDDMRIAPAGMALTPRHENAA